MCIRDSIGSFNSFSDSRPVDCLWPTLQHSIIFQFLLGFKKWISFEPLLEVIEAFQFLLGFKESMHVRVEPPADIGR